MLDEYYSAFAICVGTKLLEYEEFYLGMRFFDVHHDMLNEPDGKSYPGVYCSFIHEFYLHILALNITLNKNTLEDGFTSDYPFDSTKDTRNVVSDTTNASTKVAEYFSEDAEQVNCKMQHLNSAVKYGFDLLEIKISTIAVDQILLRIKLSNSKWKCVSEIITPGGAFTKGK